ncbi:hypothetical protein NIES21_56080 [Anabaenopsis circularis NIES-21]|uniref:NUDIX hydrolase n=1 Tax=Anabaenopsis circularis NIES-21 TaxID=1085406 RepID=A0A1Z4GQI8_9CYAN|nr:hypothetical protein NIES21_56080 [Anabaenopsis circularis NIES-21]
MSNLKKWKILQSEMVLNHPWCRVRQDKIELPNGKVIDDYFVSIKPEIAIILPITSNQEIVFVRQYRHAVADFLSNYQPDILTLRKKVQKSLQSENYKKKLVILLNKLKKSLFFMINPAKIPTAYICF